MSTESEVIYEEEVIERQRDDYSPYDYIEDRDDPVSFNEQTIEEWDWE